jgi:hypothetical protein
MEAAFAVTSLVGGRTHRPIRSRRRPYTQTVRTCAYVAGGIAPDAGKIPYRRRVGTGRRSGCG